MLGRLARARKRLPSRRRDEHGVVAVVVAIITCFTLIPLAAYAVDIGMQRVARRDAQAVADLVSLDLARLIDGRTYAQINPTLQALATKSAARISGGSGFTVTPQLGTLGATFDATNPDAYFVSISSGIPTAVKVTATAKVTFTFLSGTGGVTRSAVGQANATACFRMGSYAATVNSGNSALLNSLIGDSLNLGVLGYDGLATANVTVLGLATQLGVGTTDALLADTVTLNQLYLASAKALQSQGGSAANIALLNSLATASYGALPSVKIGDILALGAGNDAALASSINLLDLVAGSAFVANGTNALAVPSLTAGVPGVSSVTASLKVIEGPQGGCTGTASTSQVALDVVFTLLPSASGLGGLLGLKSGVTTLHVTAAIAPATGKLTRAFCGSPSGADISVTSALTSLSAQVTTQLSLLGIPIANLNATAATSAPTASNTVQFRIPPDSLYTAKSAGSGTVVPSISVTAGDVTLLGAISLGPLVSAITSGLITPLINPLISNVNTALVAPLSTLLGLKLGGADVFLTQLSCTGSVSLTG